LENKIVITYDSLTGDAGWHEFQAKAENLCSECYEPYEVFANSKVLGSSETVKFRKSKFEWQISFHHCYVYDQQEYNSITRMDEVHGGWIKFGFIERRSFPGERLFLPFLPRSLTIYSKRNISAPY
jgi:hypothetical protein